MTGMSTCLIRKPKRHDVFRVRLSVGSKAVPD